MTAPYNKDFLKLLRQEIDASIQTLLGDSHHSLYNKLYDDLLDTLDDTDVGNLPTTKDLIFNQHFFFYSITDKDQFILEASQFTLDVKLCIRCNLGLFFLKSKCLICKDSSYGLIADIVGYEIESIVPEP